MASSFPSALPPRVPSAGSNLHVTASDISLFSRSDDEGGAEDAMDTEAEQLAARTLASEQQDGDEGETLGQELLEALRLGTSNFLLAYNTRAGIAALLRLLKLLQRRDWKAVTDLRQLLDEKHLAFRLDAVRLGLFLGWFTGGYRGLRALLPVILRLLLPRKQLQDDKKLKEVSALGAGAIAALALGFVDAKRRRSLALYALTRALQCGYNTAKRQKRWHFWGSNWQYGDALLFSLSSAQVMYAYVMRPRTLPPEYFRFIQRTGPVELETLELGNRKPGIPRDFPLPTDIVPCRLLHPNADSCAVGTLLCFKRAFLKTFPLYLSLFIVPGVVIHFKRFLRAPFRTLVRSTLNATRSNCFLASFVSLYLSLVCLHQPKSRRSELALYVLPRALDSLAMILHDRGICSGFKYGEVALFSASMAVMMHCYEHETESMSPFVYSTMKRFLQTSTDKKQLYVASSRKRSDAARSQSYRLQRQQMAQLPREVLSLGILRPDYFQETALDSAPCLYFFSCELHLQRKKL
ncbi:hypothetical protein PRNP1_009766 [Phytophthora ramorum]